MGDEPFGVFLGDDIIVSRPRPACASSWTSTSSTTAPSSPSKRVPRDAASAVRRDRGGRRVGENVYEVHDLVEKPAPEDAPSDLAIIGRYVLTPDLFPILAETAPDRRGEIQLTDGLRTLRARRPIYAVRVQGKRYDTGDKLGFLKATVDFALARPDLADAFRAYLKGLKL